MPHEKIGPLPMKIGTARPHSCPTTQIHQSGSRVLKGCMVRVVINTVQSHYRMKFAHRQAQQKPYRLRTCTACMTHSAQPYNLRRQPAIIHSTMPTHAPKLLHPRSMLSHEMILCTMVNNHELMIKSRAPYAYTCVVWLCMQKNVSLLYI